MKTITSFVTLMTILVTGLAGSAWAYEGGTKFIATMIQPEKGEGPFGPLLVVSSQELSPSKLVQELLYRVPEPTFSIERIRTETPGRSSGTKAVILFQERR